MRRNGKGLTDVGRRRLANEDAFFCDDALGLYIVADGMGGHAAGEIASQEAVDTVHGMVKRDFNSVQAIADNQTDSEALRKVTRLVESAAQAATYMVYGLAQHDPEQQGMGTTLSVLLLAGDYGITAQVGDSRIYLIRNGQACQLTEDHTLVAWQLKQGIISEEEAKVSPHKNVITRAVGSREYVQVDTHFFEVHPGDAFLLCSDGLHGYLHDYEIPAVSDLGPIAGTQRFIEMANARGGKDNITAVMVDVLDVH
ncbi:MAG: PP2C family serine/threonine-protein phosphatase [Myxococcota bacterium]